VKSGMDLCDGGGQGRLEWPNHKQQPDECLVLTAPVRFFAAVSTCIGRLVYRISSGTLRAVIFLLHAWRSKLVRPGGTVTFIALRSSGVGSLFAPTNRALALLAVVSKARENVAKPVRQPFP
jgi:hypothetical protein